MVVEALDEPMCRNKHSMVGESTGTADKGQGIKALECAVFHGMEGQGRELSEDILEEEGV